MPDLTDLQQDALTEIFNIGVGRAGASLSQIVQDTVELSAPTVHIVRRTAAPALLGEQLLDQISAVSQDFRGPFLATATLIFPEMNGLEIVRLMVGPHLKLEELSEFEQEAMCEIGNIILNACMSSLADLFHVTFASTLPSHYFGKLNDMALLGGDDDNDVVLTLQVNISIAQKRIHGYLVFLLSVTSMNSLLALVDNYLREQGLA